MNHNLWVLRKPTSAYVSGGVPLSTCITNTDLATYGGPSQNN